MNQTSEIETKKGSTNDSTLLTVVPGKQEVIVKRIFNAPRELVFKIFTDPKHIPNWWGPKILKTIVEKMDVRPGGIWRFIQSDPEGKEYAFHGVYHEVTQDERIINTFEFEGLPEKGHVILETQKFEELSGNKTQLILHSVYQSVEDRDGMINAGMESGFTESMDRLEELIIKELK